MAVDEASFNISIEAMSLVLKSLSDAFSRGKPSTTINGSFDALIEPTPLIRMVGRLPGALFVTIETPAAVPFLD
jgi:hypothetical protein